MGSSSGSCCGKLVKSLRVPTIVLALSLATGAVIDVGSYSPLLPLDLLAWPSALLLVLRLKAFKASPLLWLGERSYGIYLVHYPVLTIFHALVGKSHASVTGVIGLYLAFTIIVLALSDVALRFVERPGRRALRAAWADIIQRHASRLAGAMPKWISQRRPRLVSRRGCPSAARANLTSGSKMQPCRRTSALRLAATPRRCRRWRRRRCRRCS